MLIDLSKYSKRFENNILGLGMSYVYDKNTETDSVITVDGQQLRMENTSSGLQSLIPQFVYINYLCNGIFQAESKKRERTYSEKQNFYNVRNNFIADYFIFRPKIGVFYVSL